MDPSTNLPANEATMELLAPAGSMQAFEAALEEGADAVYVGAPGCNARALARDFTFAEIEAMVGYGHKQGRKVYIAMNSLVKETELGQVVDTLAALAAIGPDALIIQDLGVLYLAYRFFPQIPRHASTMMAVHNSQGADYLTGMGFERVVLARELSLGEIQDIGCNSRAGLEIFIHGAMCFSYSGLCLFSSMFGGKSSLRGQCVQPCRRRYSKRSSAGKKRSGNRSSRDEGYLFSMNDLCGIDYLEELRRTGVLSLKIEGRLKSIEYVRKTVRAYRMVLDALDSPAEKQQAVRREARQLLNQAMGRRRSTGYFNEQQRHTLVTPHISGHTGTMVGEIKGSASGKEGGIRAGLLVHLTLKAPLTVGDRLRFHDERTGTSQSFTLRSMQQQGRVVSQAGKGQRVALRIPASKGTAAGRRLKGRLFRVDVSARHERTKTMLARRVKRGWQPKVDQQSRAAILQEFPGITSSPDPQTAAGQQGGRRAGLHPADGGGGNTPQWWVRLRSLRDLRQRLPVKPAKIIVAITSQNLEFLTKANKRVKAGRQALIWALPPIIQEDELSWHREAVTFLRQAGYEEFQVSSLAQLGLFAALEPVQVHGDFRFNLLNSLALQQAYSAGLASVQFSIETDRHNAASTLRGYAAIDKARRSVQGKMKIGALVYGRPALFSSRLQNKQLHSLRSIVSPHGEAFTLDRADGLTCVRAQVPYSLLGHHHALTAFGLDFFVLDVSVGQLHKEGAMIRSLLGGKGPSEPILSGNFDGGLS